MLWREQRVRLRRQPLPGGAYGTCILRRHRGTTQDRQSPTMPRSLGCQRRVLRKRVVRPLDSRSARCAAGGLAEISRDVIVATATDAAAAASTDGGRPSVTAATPSLSILEQRQHRLICRLRSSHTVAGEVDTLAG